MSYDTVVEKVKTLPESSEQTMIAPLVESDEEFNASMQQGFDDMKSGCVTPLKDAFADIKAQFSILPTADEIWIR